MRFPEVDEVKNTTAASTAVVRSISARVSPVVDISFFHALFLLRFTCNRAQGHEYFALSIVAYLTKERLLTALLPFIDFLAEKGQKGGRSLLASICFSRRVKRGERENWRFFPKPCSN